MWKANGVDRFVREELTRPPLLEAMFEVRVESEVPYALVPGHLHADLGKDLPTVKEIVPTVFLGQVEPPPLAFHRFENIEGTRLVQCGPGLLSINMLGDYGRFENFEALIRRGLVVYRRVARPSKIVRLGLRYINLLDEAVVQGEWPFAVKVTPPVRVPDRVAEVRTRINYRPADSANTLSVLMSYPTSLPDGKVGALLDLDCFTEIAPQGDDAIVEWAAAAHEKIYQAFRAHVEPVYGRLKEGR